MLETPKLLERLRAFVRMEDHPGGVAFLDAIEAAANAIEKKDVALRLILIDLDDARRAESRTDWHLAITNGIEHAQSALEDPKSHNTKETRCNHPM